MNFKQLYNSNLGENGKYQSVSYQMTRFNNLHRELFKAQYIKERHDRQAKLRELLKSVNPSDKSGYVPPRKEQKTHKDLGFDSYDAYLKYEQKGMIYGGWVWQSYKRQTELENYILDRYENADNILQKDGEFQAICYLIDEMFIYHLGIFDEPTADYVYSDEYNPLIFDALQLKVNEISNLEVLPINEAIKAVVNKPLRWNAEKQILGTLFGVFKQEGVITGTYSDISKGLAGLFDNLSESTLQNNLKLNENVNEGKVYYSKETEKIVKNYLLEYVKGTIKKSGK